MTGQQHNAGTQPAFLDYSALGKNYAMLLEQARNGHCVHAYLITGAKGIGKTTFARYLAAALLCNDTDGMAPCGLCDACVRVYTGNNPDVVEVLSQDDKAISIDRIRDTIATISQHSFGSGPRIVLIEPMEKLTPAAQNALLKSLEEPQANVVFFLLAHDPSSLLGTISSRCALVRLSPWPDWAMRTTLTAAGFQAQQIDATLPRASGNIGLAIGLLQNDSSESDLQTLINQALSATSDADVVSLSTKLKDDREGSQRTLRALEQTLHQALLLQTGILTRDSISDATILAWGQHASTRELTGLLQSVFDARRLRQSQVNWQACIDRLLMKIVEAKTKWQQS